MDILAMLISLPLAFTLFWCCILLAKSGTKSSNLPPGPTPLPVIGNLHKLGHHPHKSLFALSKKYGPIMHLKLGSISTTVISSSQTAKHVLQIQDRALSNRFVLNALHAHSHFEYSAAWLPVGDRWRSLRKIMNSNIFSGNKLDANQHLRSKKMEELVEYCRMCSHTCEAVDIGQAAFRTSLNLLSNTIFSKDLMDPFKDSGREFKDLVRDIMAEAGKPNLVDYFPLLKKLDPQGIRKRMTLYLNKVFIMLRDLINERLELRKFGNCVGSNDVIDELLNISQDNPNDMEHLILDLFIAGTDTTSSSVEWALAELLKNPEAMAKGKDELKQVIGHGKMVQEADVSRLPYLQSIVKETWRIHPPAPLLIPRKAIEEVEVCGYTIPKGSQVMVNAWAIGRDPGEWDNPLSFQPDRFVGSDIDVKGRDFALIPFGAGRRICPGLPLAVRMVPVMLGSLLNLFDWKIEGGIDPKELNMDEKFGLTLQRLHPLRAIPTPAVN